MRLIVREKEGRREIMRTELEGERMTYSRREKKRENYINVLLFLRVECQLSRKSCRVNPPTPRPQSLPPLPDEKKTCCEPAFWPRTA